jgi:hypothetical protein
MTLFDDFLHISSDDAEEERIDVSTMDPAMGVKKIIESVDNFGHLLDRAQNAADEASELTSKINMGELPNYKFDDWCVLSNIKDRKKPIYDKLNYNDQKFVLVDIRGAPIKCCQGCGITGYKIPERPSIPNEIVYRKDNSTTICIMDTTSVCADCLPDMSVVTVISHSWEARNVSLPVRSIGTGPSHTSISRKVIAILERVDGWIWVDVICNQSSADSNMRTRMYATCKIGIFAEQMDRLIGHKKGGWHQRLWCLIEAMYCRKIAMLVIGKIDDRNIEIQIKEIKNMYGWFYATCRLLRMQLNDRNIRQKIIHWGETNWHAGREKAAAQLRVSISTAAMGWIAGAPSTLPGRCSCPKNVCVTEALLNYGYKGTHYGCEYTLHGIKIGLSPRAAPERPCPDVVVSRWYTGENKLLFTRYKCDHMIIIDSATITIPSGDWYVYSNDIHLHCVETLPGELHMEKMRTIVYIQNVQKRGKNGTQSDYCLGK